MSRSVNSHPGYEERPDGSVHVAFDLRNSPRTKCGWVLATHDMDKESLFAAIRASEFF